MTEPQDEIELTVQGLRTEVTRLSLLASLDPSSLCPVASDLHAAMVKLSELIAAAYRQEAA